jgi:hypothetical protein
MMMRIRMTTSCSSVGCKKEAVMVLSNIAQQQMWKTDEEAGDGFSTTRSKMYLILSKIAWPD